MGKEYRASPLGQETFPHLPAHWREHLSVQFGFRKKLARACPSLLSVLPPGTISCVSVHFLPSPGLLNYGLFLGHAGLLWCYWLLGSL